MQYHDLINSARGELWAIRPDFFEASLREAAALGGGNSSRLPKVKGGVAIIPIYGMITQRGSMFGGTSTQAFEAAFSRAMNASGIDAIVLDVDSPGGTTSGVESASDLVYSARGVKPVVAIANSQAASAAYWIASSAKTFVGAPGADVGSVGVFRMHEDISGMMEREGVKVTFIAEPATKVEGNPFEPLSEQGLEHQREQVLETYGIFDKAVRRNRGISSTGSGRVFHSRQAKEMGLVDRVETLDQVLTSMGAAGKSISRADEMLERELCSAWETCDPGPSFVRSVNVARKRMELDTKHRFDQ